MFALKVRSSRRRRNRDSSASWGGDVIGMTAMPEARLAREAELCYATIAMVTDFDVWHETNGPVTVEMVTENLHKNGDTARALVRAIAAAGLARARTVRANRRWPSRS